MSRSTRTRRATSKVRQQSKLFRIVSTPSPPQWTEQHQGEDAEEHRKSREDHGKQHQECQRKKQQQEDRRKGRDIQVDERDRREDLEVSSRCSLNFFMVIKCPSGQYSYYNVQTCRNGWQIADGKSE